MKCFVYHKVWACVLFFVCIQNFFGTAASDECKLPGGEPGDCVELSACHAYLALLQDSSTTELGLKMTQERQCGLAGINVKVCCPKMVMTRIRDLDPEDFVDELPAPDQCGRPRVEQVPYGAPVKSGPAPVAYSGPFPASSYQADVAENQKYSTLVPFQQPIIPDLPTVTQVTPLKSKPAAVQSNATPPNIAAQPIANSGPEFPPLKSKPAAIPAVPYVWSGTPVKTRAEAPEGMLPSNDSRDTPAVNSKRVRSIWSGTVVKTRRTEKRHDKESDHLMAHNNTQPDYEKPTSTHVLGGFPVRKRGTRYSEYPPPAIEGGTPVKRIEMSQWMALLAYNVSGLSSSWECGGSIITKKHVLTAAHCIRDDLYVVRVGELDLAQTNKLYNPIDYYIKRKIPHENYTKFHNDIGILVVDGTIPIDDRAFSYIAPVCLPEAGFPYKKNGPIATFITGWGESEEKGRRPTNLLYAYLNILDQEQCKKVYDGGMITIDERVFCAGDWFNGRDACNGDSGGPLIGKYLLPDYGGVFFYQIGLISFGYRCDAKQFTGVYTNITFFMPWILEKVTGRADPRQWTKTTPAPSIDSHGSYYDRISL